MKLQIHGPPAEHTEEVIVGRRESHGQGAPACKVHGGAPAHRGAPAHSVDRVLQGAQGAPTHRDRVFQYARWTEWPMVAAFISYPAA